MMSDSIQDSSLTPLEFEIMSVLWEISPGSVRDVQEHQSLSNRNLAYNTVQTMLNILVRKKKARREKQGRAFYYKPTLSKRQVAVAEVSELLDRLFEGNAERLVLSLVETRRLSAEKLAELKAFFEKEVSQ